MRTTESLSLDLSFFDGYELHHGFELSEVFTLDPGVATQTDVRALLGWRASALAQRILTQPTLSWLRGNRLVIEPHLHYWPGISTVAGNAYLAGYWQSEKYFRDAVQTMRTDLSFRHPLSARNAELADEIDAITAISLHVRRGDYVSDPRTNAVLGVCSLDYYRAAIAYIADRVRDPAFFIFSDDIAWAKANLEIRFPSRYIDHNQGTQSYNDMRLMSLCRHHIIANSSFSWWGAWLNPSSEKTVIAPRNWFANDSRSDDLFPAGWVTI